VKNVQPVNTAPTRGQVARLILELGPSTAATLGGRLGLTPAAIRRHLDNLIAEGLIETRTARTYGNRGRGRPAKVFVITDAGRSAFEHAYDDLATSALRFLAETAGPDAIADFARRQVADLERRYAPALAGGELTTRVQALAEALSADGYAASAGPAPAIGGLAAGAGESAAGEQLCQHHCTWRPSSRSCARPRPRRSAGCSARRCSGSLRSRTAMASAPLTSPAPPGRPARPR
jgi:predicted ArsR family transcriptional regulator